MLHILLIGAAFGHKPSFGGDYVSEDSAFEIVDPNISIVVYQELTCELPELWLEFEADADFELYVQLGVPVTDWLEDYAPTVAVVAHGLPLDAEVPFDLPTGMGAMVYEARSDADTFYEPFTQTSSWVWVEERLSLPESGKGYVVGWHPEMLSGKIWIATGEVEDFSDVSPLDFVFWDEQVNNFHETGEYETPADLEVFDCEALLAPQEEVAAGCATMKTKPAIVLIFLSVWGVLFRRRENPLFG